VFLPFWQEDNVYFLRQIRLHNTATYVLKAVLSRHFGARQARKSVGWKGSCPMAQSLSVLRTEKKYPVSPITAGQIAARLSYVLKYDPNCPGGQPYRIKSVYFDSFYDRDFAQKESGLELRRKIRLRTYGQDSPIKLEWKQKQGAKQQKHSLLISRAHAEQILQGDYRCLTAYDGELPLQFYAVMTEQVYRPKCLIQYQRLAYHLPTNDIRVTLDSGISAYEGVPDLWADHPAAYPVLEAGKSILEVKYNHFLLDYVKTALAGFDLTETANSKYTAGRYFGLGGTFG